MEIHKQCKSPTVCLRSGNCESWMRTLTGCAAGADDPPADLKFEANPEPLEGPEPMTAARLAQIEALVEGQSLCEACSGTGHLGYISGDPEDETCSSCSGTGRAWDPRAIITALITEVHRLQAEGKRLRMW